MQIKLQILVHRTNNLTHQTSNLDAPTKMSLCNHGENYGWMLIRNHPNRAPLDLYPISDTQRNMLTTRETLGCKNVKELGVLETGQLTS
jgi:hypothetical protein